ncbi:hypothetical protein PR003_g31205, partial [Phytophthora rubi]
MNRSRDEFATTFRKPPTKREKIEAGVKLRRTSSDGSSSDDFGGMTDAFSSQEAPTLGSPDSPTNAEEKKRASEMSKTWTSGLVEGTMEIPERSVKLHERKSIMDCVHGLMTFEPICMRIIDTLQFQRLRNLHQLGPASFVYIGATHSRFEHCLGVAYLAEKMMESIRSHQPWLPIIKEDVLCIKIAGLCHDLGHGPFSHVFDGLFLDQLRKKKLISQSFKWSHEQGSVDMFDFLLA